MEYTYLDCLSLFGVGGAHPGGLQLTKHLLAQENIDENMSILDAGCGTGQTSAFLAEKYRCHVTSIDFNKMMLNKAKKRFTSLNLPSNFIQASVESLPFNDEIFDIILSESVTSFTNPSLTIPEFKRVLKRNGTLIAIEMVLEKPLSEQEVKPIINFYGVSQLFNEAKWYHLFERAGFKQITIENFGQQFDETNVQNAADFSLSETIDEQLIEVLEEHEQLLNIYKDILGFRIFKCYA
ncbi:class I SAM-dependent methyltransferase [Aquibacillus saliphilus]|uniref:class I SAM-dependent methyltransferase n=1 Tax=Aquibacillus saliphilus TaxID=1909422 RepID=UPI001CF014BC|nr:class I SAM-dependent methyltransferase [Aquibacillus saliphilus]